MSRFVAEILRQIEDTIRDRLYVPAQRITGQIGGGQVARGSTSAPGVVALSAATPHALGTAAPGSTGDASDAGHIHAMPTAADVGAVPTGRTLTIGGVAYDLSADRTWAGGGGGSLTIEEVDGSPSVAATKLKLPNGTLSVSGTEATYTPAGGGGGAPDDAPYITAAVDAGLSGAIVIPGLAASPDIAGAAGGAVSEEWDTATTGLTWSPGAPATVNSNTTVPSHLYLETTDSTLRFGLMAFAPSGDFDARLRYEIGTVASDWSGPQFGLIVANSDNSVRVLVTLDGINTFRVYSYNGGWSAGNTLAYANQAGYLRITRNGSTVTAWASSGGRLWMRIHAFSFSITVAQVGIYTGPTSLVAACDWLRATG